MHHRRYATDGRVVALDGKGRLVERAEVIHHGVHLLHAVAHQCRAEHLGGDIPSRLNVAREQQGVEMAVGHLLPVDDYLSRDDVEGELLPSQIVGGDVYLGVLTAVVFATLAFLRWQGFAAEQLLCCNIAAMHKTGDRLLAILPCKLLFHKLGGICLKHAEIGEQHGEMDEIFVAVAVDELPCGRLLYIALRKGIDTFLGPLRWPFVLTYRLAVG